MPGYGHKYAHGEQIIYCRALGDFNIYVDKLYTSIYKVFFALKKGIITNLTKFFKLLGHKHLYMNLTRTYFEKKDLQYMLEHYSITRATLFMQEQGVSIEDHPTFTQLLVRLVIVVGELGDPDTIFYLLDSLKCLALNEEGLLETSR